MNIILFSESLINRAGIERMTVELANLLAEKHCVSIVLINTFFPESNPFQIDSRVSVRSLHSSFGKSFFDMLNISNIRGLRRHLREIMPDVLITVATPLGRISVPAVAGLGIINIGWEHFHLYAGSRIGSLYKILIPWFFDSTVVLTKADLASFQECHAPGIVEIPNFTSLGKEGPLASIKNKILLAVGRHAEQKGFDLLIRAWSKSHVAGWRLRIVGSGEKRSSNIQLAKDLGVSDSIDFIDSTTDIESEYRQASCFVLSSRFEGLVLALIEAKMMGLPSISFDCPNSPREIIRDGVDGWLVPNGDVEGLARCLSLHLSDMDGLARAGKLAREDAIARYSPTAVASIWEDLITRLVKH